MNVRITLDPQAVTDSLRAEEAARKLAELLLQKAASRVPLDTGALRDSGAAEAGEGGGLLRYTVPYAAYQYYGVSPSGQPLHYQGAPERGSGWVLRSWEAEKDGLLPVMKEYLQNR